MYIKSDRKWNKVHFQLYLFSFFLCFCRYHRWTAFHQLHETMVLGHAGPMGGSHIDMVYVYVPAFWVAFSLNLVQRSGGFSSETKEPKLHKVGVFWANYCEKHPIWSKLGAFLSKLVYWWVGNWAKYGIEKVRFSRYGRHTHIQFWWK